MNIIEIRFSTADRIQTIKIENEKLANSIFKEIHESINNGYKINFECEGSRYSYIGNYVVGVSCEKTRTIN